MKQILENRGRKRVEFYHIYILYTQQKYPELLIVTVYILFSN